jgi:signal transduction histidine kinase
MKRKWEIAGVNFDHMHMGDLLRQVPAIDGERIFKGTFRICYNHSGQAVGINGVLTDVSDLVLEKEELENTVVAGRAAATAHLAYLESIFHEIRTPLNALHGGLQQLQELELNPEAREALKFVEQGTVALSLLLPAVLAEDQRSARGCQRDFLLPGPPADRPHSGPDCR